MLHWFSFKVFLTFVQKYRVHYFVCVKYFLSSCDLIFCEVTIVFYLVFVT